MKPLELVHYRRPHPGEDGFWEYRARLIAGRSKRLTGPELAAMFWMSSSRGERMLGYSDGPGSATAAEAHKEHGRMEVIERFATLPHYDDEADQ